MNNEKYPNANRRWTKAEIIILKTYYGILPYYVIAKMLGRSPHSVLMKASKLGLKSNYPRGRIPKYIRQYIEKYFENKIMRYE